MEEVIVEHVIPEEEIIESKTIIEVSASDDGIAGFIKLTKQGPDPGPVTREELMEALKEKNIIFGIRQDMIEKLATKPIYNLKLEVARGIPPTAGEDGTNEYMVKKDMEYAPEINEEGVIDYKNLNYFQMVQKGDILCRITKEKPGRDGKNVYGGALPAKSGKPPAYPVGENTILLQNDTMLVSTCDGVVHFVRDIIAVKDLLKISSSIDQHTGNVNFSGDVSVEGDICNGYSAVVGGGLTVKGVVEDAMIRVEGNLHVSKGINGALNQVITVNGDLKCNYIENAIVHVEGNIVADYIIDSKIVCMGNIELKGKKELILGGDLKVKGELTARDIGSEKERPTKIEIIGEKIIDTQLLEKIHAERESYNEKALALIEKATSLSTILAAGKTEEISQQLALVKKQMLLIRERINYLSDRLTEVENNWHMEYDGCVVCKRKMYQGVSIYFGEVRFRFSFDNIEHCRIYWYHGEISQSTL